MHRLFFVYFWIVMFVFVLGCSRKTKECQFCGTYNFTNFTKSEKSYSSQQETRIRRSLNVSDSKGKDYFTYWSTRTDTTKDESVQQLVKNVVFPEKSFVLNADGTWLFKLIVQEEFYQQSDLSQPAKWMVERQITECGKWEYVNANQRYISMERILSTTENNLLASDFSQADTPTSDYPFYMKKRHSNDHRQFKFDFDPVSKRLTFASLVEDDSIYNRSLHAASYSFCEGDVYLTCEPNEEIGRIVQNLK